MNEEINEVLNSIVSHEIDLCEAFLDGEIRSTLSENWDYYNKVLPKPALDGTTFVDNTCQATVKHFVANAKDAFVTGDLLEVVPDAPNSAVMVEIASDMINDVLDRENNRAALYTSMFKDAAIAKVGILKPYVFEDVEVKEHRFEGMQEEQISMISDSLTEKGFEVVEEVIEEEEELDLSAEYEQMGLHMPEEMAIIRKVSGYISYRVTRKAIRIDTIPPENFLINSDAKDVRTARIVGHKNNVTLSELIEMGFDYDLVSEVARFVEDEDVDSNMATISRGKMGSLQSSESIDKSMKEVVLYEVYIKTTLSEVTDRDAEYDVAKLYRVYWSNDVVLDFEEATEAPYACGVIDPVPHSFWGESLVDHTKNIQRAKTGLVRQTLQYNALQTSPRFLYSGVSERDLMSRVPGSGIKVTEQGGQVTPIQLGTLSPVTGEITNVMDLQREQGTGITFVGQGMVGDVLKAGGSAISASMVLSEQQMVVKDAINNLLHTGIIPLCSIIYNMLRDNISEMEVNHKGQVIKVDPMNQLPPLREVRIKAPLGASAKLEKANAYNSMFMAISNPQMPITTFSQVKLLAKVFEHQDIKDAMEYLPTEEEIQQQQMLPQLQQQLQEMQMQVQELSMQNQQLQQIAGEMAQKQMELQERTVVVQEMRAEVDASSKADKQALEEEKAQASMMERADLADVKEREQTMKEAQTKFEMANKTVNLFRI